MNLTHTSIFRTEFTEMLRIGVPAGVQGMIFSFANIFIQSSINRFGADAVAGSAAALNYEYYCFFVISAFAQAAVAFTGQNFGAGNRARCRKVFIYCMVMSFISCGSLNIFIAWHPGFFLHFFTDNPDVIIYGTTRLRYVLMFQFIASSYEIAGAAMRGFGYSMTPMLLTVFGTCVLRLGWIYTVCRDNDDFHLLLTVYPLSWVITGIITLAAYYYLWHRTRNSVSISPVQG